MSQRPEAVLVVEDEVLIRMAMAEALRREGFRVFEACNANEALDIIDSGQVPDALLTDIRMPGAMDGLALAAYLEAVFPDMEIFITSGHVARADLRVSINFLAKPMAPQDVARTIANRFPCPGSVAPTSRGGNQSQTKN